MSGGAPDLAEQVDILITTTDVAFAQLAVAAYEYIITFDQEVSIVWNRKLNAVSLLLVITRWLMVVEPILAFIPLPTQASCETVLVTSTILILVNLIIITLFSALRVYALLLVVRMRYLIPAAICILGLVPIATNILNVSKTTITHVPQTTSCVQTTTVSPALATKLIVGTRASAIALDALVLVTTWAQSFQQFRHMRRLKLHSSVATILLRDGTLYFIALLAINAFQAATPKTTSLEGGYINEILEFMPPVLVQRFIMNLRRPDSEEHEAAAGQSGTGSSINFRPPSTFLGNLGEPLDHGSAAELEQHTVNDETGSSGQEASTMI